VCSENNAWFVCRNQAIVHLYLIYVQMYIGMKLCTHKAKYMQCTVVTGDFFGSIRLNSSDCKAVVNSTVDPRNKGL
jgi:hypothetical protein